MLSNVDSESKNIVLLSTKQGQLGNRLFQYAHFLGLGIQNRISIVNLAFSEFAHFFRSSENLLFCRHPQNIEIFKNPSFEAFVQMFLNFIEKARENSLPLDLDFVKHLSTKTSLLDLDKQTAIEVRELLYNFASIFTAWLKEGKVSSDLIGIFSLKSDQETMTLNQPDVIASLHKNQITVFDGWDFRDHDNVKKHAPSIRKFFEPTLTIQRQVEGRIRSLRQRSEKLIGIHIRRGDYKNWQAGRYYFSLEQYRNLMNSLLQLHAGINCLFLLCSDEKLPANCFGTLNVCIEPAGAMEDLYTLAACDLLVGPPSTFSSWASFYGEVPIYQIWDMEKIPSFEDFSTIKS